ncbi:MAG TPA: elongation factor 1-beta [Candidatus Thermoplasmatota archaeon]|nr:elongation factor 1-beta [Candidatus Thermoplasmatota archaeon]
MGTVVALIRVLPDSPQVDREKLKTEIRAAIPGHVKLQSIAEKPIAFGLVSLAVTITLPDGSPGGADAVQDILAKLPNVQSAETTDVGLL